MEGRSTGDRFTPGSGLESARLPPCSTAGNRRSSGELGWATTCFPVAIAKPLFPARHREDSGIQRANEWTYKFLDRVDDPVFARVRDLLNAWFERFARHQEIGATNDLRGRLRAKQSLQFESAFWELYLHELHLRLGFDIEVHPPGPRTTHPDFLLTRGSERFYLEAVLPVPSEGRLDQPAGAATVTEYLGAAYNPDFFLALRFIAGGGPVPRRKAVAAEVERWLSELDWQLFHDGSTIQYPLPENEITVDDWLIGLQAYPRSPVDRGNRDAPMVRIFPGISGWPDAIMAAVAPTLDEKASKYGELDAPHVVAAWVMSPFAHEDALASTLFGTRVPLDPGRHDLMLPAAEERNGLWTPDRARRHRPSAILLAGNFDFNYNAVARWLPRLWHNAWSAQPCEVELPFATSRVSADEQEIENRAATTIPSEIFGLDATWPGVPFAHLNSHQ